MSTAVRHVVFIEFMKNRHPAWIPARCREQVRFHGTGELARSPSEGENEKPLSSGSPNFLSASMSDLRNGYDDLPPRPLRAVLTVVTFTPR